MAESFMQIASPSPPIPPVTTATRCAISTPPKCIGCAPPQQRVERISRLFPHVTPRRGLDLGVLRAARGARLDARTAVLLEPRSPVRPPAPRMRLGLLQPGF